MENSQIFWNLELNIKPGKLDALKVLADEMTKATQANEPDTMNYVWSLDTDNKSCHIFERYTDSDAVRTHLGNFQAFAERFFDCMDVSRFQVYGNADAQLKEALAGLGAQFFNQFDGYYR
jgi:quinol monooxygenase YgiN